MLIALSSVAVSVAVFQFFLRYNYVHDGNAGLVRIDRITTTSCIMPCLPTPPPTPSPQPTAFDEDVAYFNVGKALSERNLSAVELAKTTAAVQSVTSGAGSGYKWNTGHDTVSMAYALVKAPKYDAKFSAMMIKLIGNPVLVCLCKPDASGWYWQVDLANRRVHYVNDNADLTKMYNLTASK